MGVDRKSRGEPTLYTWVPPNWHLAELAVVTEVQPEALALVLWRAVARVRLWSEPEEGREKLFSARTHPEELARRAEARSIAPELSGALDVLDGLTSPDLSILALTRACAEISAWAEERGFLETAVQFAEAAAGADPDNPALATAAGRVCRRAGERGRAEVWYARGIGLAREAQRRTEYISAHLGLAAVLRDGGQHSRALRLIRRAANVAQRAGIRDKAAESYHDAMSVALLDRHFTRAAHLARRAIRIYPARHRRFPAFAYDVAFLLVNQGVFSLAKEILPEAANRMSAAHERLVVLGTLARAAGGAGEVETFTATLETIADQASIYRSTGAGALYSAAEGARLLRRWEDAERLVGQAIHAARENDLPIVLERAQTLHAEVGARAPGIAAANDGDPRTRYLEELGKEALRRLLRWRPRKAD